MNSKQSCFKESAGKIVKVLFRRKVVIVAAVVMVAFILMAVFAPLIAPYDPYEQNLINRNQDPSSEHILGTDALGRDLLSRIIYGTRVSLMVGLFATIFASIIGTAIGLTVGYIGGVLDSVVMRIVDAILSIPPLVQAMVVGTILGSGLVNVSITIGFSMIPTYVRIARGQVLSIKLQEYVNASIAVGTRTPRLLVKHILPNCISPIIVLMTQNLGSAMLTEANLSFIGLGIAPPTASWGAMVSQGQAQLINHPLISIAPGLCIMLIVLAFNIFGDGVRDALDPRLRNK